MAFQKPSAMIDGHELKLDYVKLVDFKLSSLQYIKSDFVHSHKTIFDHYVKTKSPTHVQQ